MRCPSCNKDQNHVVDSRLTEAGAAVRRRRECQSCGKRFTTKERVDQGVRLMVVKVGGQTVPYERDKVLAGVERACYKLNIGEEALLGLVDGVEEEILRRHDRETTSEAIGQMVSERLRKLHAVAYIRFMSVYRKFGSVNEFIDEITHVKARAEQDDPTQRALFES